MKRIDLISIFLVLIVFLISIYFAIKVQEIVICKFCEQYNFTGEHWSADGRLVDCNFSKLEIARCYVLLYGG